MWDGVGGLMDSLDDCGYTLIVIPMNLALVVELCTLEAQVQNIVECSGLHCSFRNGMTYHYPQEMYKYPSHIPRNVEISYYPEKYV